MSTTTLTATSTLGGSVTVNPDGSFTYVPTADIRHAAAAVTASDAAKTDSFTVFVADGHGGGTSIAVIVPIAPESDEPPTGEEV